MATYGPEGVVWVAPETLQSEQREALVLSHKGSPEELLEKLNNVAALPGEYRKIIDPENDDPALGSATRVEGAFAITEYEEDRLVCVGEQQYEVYDPDVHGEPYSPLAPELRGAEPRTVEK